MNFHGACASAAAESGDDLRLWQGRDSPDHFSEVRYSGKTDVALSSFCSRPRAELAGRIARLAASSAYYDFTDLDDRGLVGIVWDVSHYLCGMRPKTSMECLDRFAEDVARSDIRRGSSRRSTREAPVFQALIQILRQFCGSCSKRSAGRRQTPQNLRMTPPIPFDIGRLLRYN
jgi:hypothetical protein